MSPEQFSNRSLDGRADQYSLGVVAFELLAGRRPFVGESMPQVLRGHLLDTPPDVREFRPDCPPVIADAINRMLSKSPDERFPTLDPFVTLLEGIPGIDQEQLRAQISSLARSMSLTRPRITMVASPLSSRPVPVVKVADEMLGSVAPNVQAKGFWVKNRTLLFASALVAVIAGGGSVLAAMKKNPQAVPGNVTGAAMPPASTPAGATPAFTNPTLTASVPAPNLSSKKNAVVLNTVPKGDLVSKQVPARTIPEVKKGAPSMMLQAVDSALPSAPSQSVIAAPTVPVTPVIFDGIVRIGSRVPRAGLYVDGVFAGLIGAIREFQHKPGQVRLQIRAEDCASWDSVLYLGPGDTAKINIRNPRCNR